MIKAAFFDLDGTLISSSGTYTHAVQTALTQLRSNGILVFAATGRVPYELNTTGMINGLPFDAIVSMNGQYCYVQNTVIHEQLFDKDDLARILLQIEKQPFSCAFAEKEDLYVNAIDGYMRLAMADCHTQPPRIQDTSDILDRDIMMVMAYLPQELSDQYLRPILQNSDMTRWNQHAIDVVPAGVSKRTGIETVLKKYGLAWDSVIAFGDGENDIEMLENARYGVAMGNAVPQLLGGQFYVTDHVDRDGVVLALRHFDLL